MSAAHPLRPARRSDPAERSDAEAMRALAQGDVSALAILYDRYHEAVLHFVHRATGGSADADDIAQAVFLTVLRAAARFEEGAAARPFLIGVAAQLVRRRRRGLARLAQAITAAGAIFSSRARGTPEESAAAAEAMDRFEEALSALPLGKRLVFLMIEREGMRGEDVAEALGIPVATVWTRLHAARCALRRAVQEGER